MGLEKLQAAARIAFENLTFKHSITRQGSYLGAAQKKKGIELDHCSVINVHVLVVWIQQGKGMELQHPRWSGLDSHYSIPIFLFKAILFCFCTHACMNGCMCHTCKQQWPYD